MINQSTQQATGFHQILNIAGCGSAAAIKHLTHEYGESTTMQGELNQLFDGYQLDASQTNYTTIDNTTGVESHYSRLLDNETIDAGNKFAFSDAMQPHVDSRSIEVSASVSHIPVKTIESEIEDVTNELTQAKTEKAELDQEFEKLQQHLRQQQVVEQEIVSPASPTLQTEDSEAPKEAKDTKMGTPTAGQILANGIASLFRRNRSSDKPRERKQWASNVEAKLVNQTIKEQCAQIDTIIANIGNKSICNDKQIAGQLFDDLSQKIVTLNQTISKENKVTLSSNGTDKEIKAQKLSDDMKFVEKTMKKLGDSSDTLNSVMEKFNVKIDMKAIQESIKNLAKQVRETMQLVFNNQPDASPSTGV